MLYVQYGFFLFYTEQAQINSVGEMVISACKDNIRHTVYAAKQMTL